MTRTKIKCEFCGREISKSNYTKHIRSHKNGNFDKTISHTHLDHDDLFCKYCGKECKNKNSLIQHEIRCKKNPNKINTIIEGFNCNLRNVAWSKGLTKETDDRVRKRAETFRKNIESGKTVIKGHPQTEETREKLSKIRKNYLSNNPDKVPYLLNHSSKTSYPEKYFMDVFENEGINFKYHHRVNKYELDFCDIEIKIDVEIDGEQHYTDKRISNSDRDRDIFLTNLGWTVYRIRWSFYEKLKYEERKIVINEIKNLIKNSGH